MQGSTQRVRAITQQELKETPAFHKGNKMSLNLRRILQMESEVKTKTLRDKVIDAFEGGKIVLSFWPDGSCKRWRVCNSFCLSARS